MSKTLVVYHSRSGHTRQVAQALAQRLHADLDQITVPTPRRGLRGYVRCALEAIAEVTPPLRALQRDPHDYELVVVGTPVWFWSLASPVRSYLRQERGAQVRFAFFCTMGSAGATRVFESMAALTGRPPVATLALTEQEVAQPRNARLDAFVQALQGRRSTNAGARPARLVRKAA